MRQGNGKVIAVRDEGLRRKMRLGSIVFAGLLVLEVVEFVVGITMKTGALIPMILLGIPSGWLILRFYMHVRQLRHGGDHA